MARKRDSSLDSRRKPQFPKCEPCVAASYVHRGDGGGFGMFTNRDNGSGTYGKTTTVLEERETPLSSAAVHM